MPPRRREWRRVKPNEEWHLFGACQAAEEESQYRHPQAAESVAEVANSTPGVFNSSLVCKNRQQ